MAFHLLYNNTKCSTNNMAGQGQTGKFMPCELGQTISASVSFQNPQKWSFSERSISGLITRNRI